MTTEEEWAGFEKRIEETVTLGQVFRLVPWASHGLSAETRKRVFDATGTARKVLWLLSHRRFRRLDRRAFRHLAA